MKEVHDLNWPSRYMVSVLDGPLRPGSCFFLDGAPEMGEEFLFKSEGVDGTHHYKVTEERQGEWIASYVEDVKKTA